MCPTDGLTEDFQESRGSLEDSFQIVLRRNLFNAAQHGTGHPISLDKATYEGRDFERLDTLMDLFFEAPPEMARVWANPMVEILNGMVRGTEEGSSERNFVMQHRTDLIKRYEALTGENPSQIMSVCNNHSSIYPVGPQAGV